MMRESQTDSAENSASLALEVGHASTAICASTTTSTIWRMMSEHGGIVGVFVGCDFKQKAELANPLAVHRSEPS